jgi:SAM-dependent methyltransferase
MNIAIPYRLKRTLRRLLPGLRRRPAGEIFDGFHVSSSDVVVDFGCGPGHSCAIAGEVGADVVAIDVDHGAVEHARRMVEQTPARSFQGLVGEDALDKLPDRMATVVLAQEVLEHVPDPAAMLSQLVRIGRTEARYLISVPDPVSEGLMRAVAPAWYFERPGHINIFQREAFDRLITSAGLTIERRVLSGAYWSIWWTLRWTTGKHIGPRSVAQPAILRHWNRAWKQLNATPQGRAAIQALNEALPKSQVVIARKAA